MSLTYSRIPFGTSSAELPALGFFHGDPFSVAAYALSGKGYVCTPNALMLEYAYKSPAFLNTLKNAAVLTPDGVGALALLRRFGVRTRRLTGVSLGLAAASLCRARSLSLFIYGGGKGRADEAARILTRRFPALKIAGTLDGYSLPPARAAARIIASRADVAFVCLGSPRQEFFMRRYLDGRVTAFGLGGSVDIYAGAVPRAPHALRAVGAEWLYRMVREPKRLAKLPSLASFYFRCGTDLVNRPKNAVLRVAHHGKNLQI